MGMPENMAVIIRMIMDRQNKSMREFADELGISLNTLQNYLKGKGNPNLKTVELLARKLEVEPAVLLTGSFEPEQQTAIYFMLDSMGTLSKLKEEKRVRSVELLLEIVRLWADGE